MQAADAAPVTSFSFASSSPDEFISQGERLNVKFQASQAALDMVRRLLLDG